MATTRPGTRPKQRYDGLGGTPGDGTDTVARGGRPRTRPAPERRWIATGETGPTAGLVRFVLGPDGTVVPDVAGKLPGRGAWLTADRALVERAVKRRLFSRAFKANVAAPGDLADRVERLLAERLINLVSLARKAGQAVTGFEKTRAWLAGGRAGTVLHAADAAEDGRAKLSRLAPDLPRIDCLDRGELGLAFGREFAIHAALGRDGGFADRAASEARRLGGFRVTGPATGAAPTVGEPSPTPADDAETGPHGGLGQDHG